VREVDPMPFFTSSDKVLADPINQGWSDTVHADIGFATTFRIRFSPISGEPSYPFDATQGPGFVWHCHILDHEDNGKTKKIYLIHLIFFLQK
jgi:FtsP/CotA-like multicopper oxidase with cupredoxin domain